jgi:hypothetical protein
MSCNKAALPGLAGSLKRIPFQRNGGQVMTCFDDLVLALDPGSYRTGWAVLDYSEQLHQAGLLTPDKMRAPSYLRINRICDDLRQLLTEWQPASIVIEWTSGKVGRRRHKGNGAGLAVHGAATGAIWREAEAWWRSLEAEQQNETSIILTAENSWTNGVPKPDRLAGIAAVFNQYDQALDKAGDIGDAIGLALWHIRERRLRLADKPIHEMTVIEGHHG